jgi:hypothetical protein
MSSLVDLSSAGSVIVGLLLYGTDGLGRDAFTEDKYRLLAGKMVHSGCVVKTLAYHSTRAQITRAEALQCQAVLVWINPAEPELNRAELDGFLRELAQAGVLVSAHPDTILRIGTKDVLVDSQSIGWSVDACAYRSTEEFRTQFPKRVREQGPQVLKQHRGHSGHGVWKVSPGSQENFVVESATRGASPETLAVTSLVALFDREVFSRGSHLVNQAWVPTMTRGMVRAYLCGRKVVGFGFQEINALYPAAATEDFTRLQPSRRHYYTEQCALFQPLRQRLEESWLPALGEKMNLHDEEFPLLWDADFFLGDPPNDYLLCEINVSCVSPFPESAITPLITELKRRLRRQEISR